MNSKFGLYNKVLDIRIKTAQIYKTGNTLADPILRLNSLESVTINFDDVDSFGEGFRDFYYTITHCDADWVKSNLIAHDYMTGYPENDVVTINQSIGTGISYYNYELELPNQEIRLKISGNYKVSIFNKSTRELVLEKGFSIYEPIVGINTIIKKATNNMGMQQLEIKVNHSNLAVRDPYTNLKLRVFQNNIPTLQHPQPSYSQYGRTDYTRPDKSLYFGINEFRSFDIRDITYRGRGVNNISLSSYGLYNVELTVDQDRDSKDYTFTKDANGKYVIDSDKAYNKNTQSDYVDVFFSLKTPEHIGCRIFIFGELTDWSLNENFELMYNETDGTYNTSVLLKQGYYNYRYIVVSGNEIDYTKLENSFYETENDYNILVYYKDIMDRYERLVGFEKINSRSTSIMN